MVSNSVESLAWMVTGVSFFFLVVIRRARVIDDLLAVDMSWFRVVKVAAVFPDVLANFVVSMFVVNFDVSRVGNVVDHSVVCILPSSVEFSCVEGILVVIFLLSVGGISCVGTIVVAIVDMPLFVDSCVVITSEVNEADV